MIDEIYLGDCLEVMSLIPDGSVDMILCDLPYGTTACKWDTVIPLEPLWVQYKRIIKKNGAIVLTASQPFTTALIASNLTMFKYCWVWDKVGSVGHLSVKHRPLQRHEEVCVFGDGLPAYYPQMIKGKMRVKGGRKDKPDQVYGRAPASGKLSDEYHPTSIIEVSNANRVGRIHPTQKPVALFEYLIKTYTNPGELVLDNCIGSGTTAIAAINTGRRFIGIEKDPEYHRIATERVMRHTLPEWLLPAKEEEDAGTRD